MCPTGIVLTDSPYDSATDTLAEKRVQKYGKSQKWCPLRMKKIRTPSPCPSCGFILLYYSQSERQINRIDSEQQHSSPSVDGLLLVAN